MVVNVDRSTTGFEGTEEKVEKYGELIKIFQERANSSVVFSKSNPRLSGWLGDREPPTPSLITSMFLRSQALHLIAQHTKVDHPESLGFRYLKTITSISSVIVSPATMSERDTAVLSNVFYNP